MEQEKSQAQAQKVGADRSTLLENYHKSVGLPSLEKEVSVDAPVDASASSDNALPKSDSDAKPVAGKSVEAPVEPSVEAGKTPDAQEKSVEKKEDEKLVSKKALDEEREKRKAKTLEARQLSEKLDAKDKAISQLEARMKELEAKLSQPAKPGAAAPANGDEVTRQLAEENKRLKDENAKAAAAANAEAAKKAQADFEGLVAQADKDLAAEGYPGFSEFRVDVARALEAKVASGELEVNEITPAHWAEAYKETVFPTKSKIFAAKTDADKAAAKKALKKDANLAKNPGHAPSAPDEEDMDAPQTSESYMKFRKKSLR